MKIGIWFFLLICCTQLSAQDIFKSGLDLESHFEDEEYDTQTELEFDFCKPGVQGKSRSKGLLLERTYNFGNSSTNSARTQSFEELKLKLKLPLINKKGFKLLVGWDHLRDSYNFGNVPDENYQFEEFDQKTLKTNKLSIYALKPLDDKLYALVNFNSSFSGDYDSFFSLEEKYASHSVLAMVGLKKDENTEMGIGVLARSVFGKKSVLPFLMYNKTFNKHWGLETILPVSIMGRYNINENNILLFGAKYNGKRHLVNLPNEHGLVNDFVLNQQSVALEISLEKKINSWTWFSVKAGYQHFLSQKFDYLNAAPHAAFDPNTGGGQPYIKIGLFLSPPDNKN